jgi:hypothetical protein
MGPNGNLQGGFKFELEEQQKIDRKVGLSSNAVSQLPE